jgi:hypothetical protein
LRIKEQDTCLTLQEHDDDDDDDKKCVVIVFRHEQYQEMFSGPEYDVQFQL